MADPVPPVVPPTSPRDFQNAARGHQRSGGRGRGTNFSSNGNNRNAGSRGGRGPSRGRGRGHTNHNRLPSTDENAQSTAQLAPQPIVDSDRATTEAVKAIRRASISNENPDEGVPERETCWICAGPIEHAGIVPCNHVTCFNCALRFRALYKDRKCLHCRTEAEFVILTDDLTKRYEEFHDQDFIKVDDNLGIKYEKNEILEDTIILLRYNCPDDSCDVACLGWPDLHRHVRSKHGKVMCDLCTRNKKAFTHEHELFTFGELRKHEKFGDDNPGAIDQSGFRGHPECGFCRKRFYGDDELYQHCKEEHERCHICDRRNEGRNPQYYLNYQKLEEHFAAEHFVCLDAECQANKTYVFESEMDLKAHQLSTHPNGMSKDMRRDARLVDISGFEIRAPYQPQRRGGREMRGTGRGRDPNAEPLPTSSAQPIGRAELAYQRQMAIVNQNPNSRTFGGQLTQSTPAPAPRPTAAQQAQALPPVENLSLNSGAPRPAQTPRDQARQLRHAAVMERASKLLGNDPTKVSSFRTHVSSYRSSTLSAPELIDNFFSLFDAQSSELGKLIRELADIYENESKRTGLLEAWNSWRAINEDYPSLPGPSGTLPGTDSNTSTSASGRRVLRLKSSTAQSSRSAVSRQGSWGNGHPANSSNEPFPSLGGAAGLANGPKKAAPWGAGVSTMTSRVPPASSKAVSRPPTTMGPRSNEEMFPSLPTTAKPSTLMAGLTKGTVRWDDHRTQNLSVNPWASGGMSPTPAQSVPVAAVEPLVEGNSNEVVGSKKKGKKGKGQILYQWG